MKFVYLLICLLSFPASAMADYADSSGAWFTNGNFYRVENGIADTLKYSGFNGMSVKYIDEWIHWRVVSSPFKNIKGDSGIFFSSNSTDAFRLKDKWMLMNSSGDKISQRDYDWIFVYKIPPVNGKDGLMFYARSGSKWALVNSRAKEITGFLYRIPVMESYKSETELSMEDENCMITDDMNCIEENVVPIDCIFRFPLVGGHAVVMLNKKYGTIDTTTGTVIIPFKYDGIYIGETHIYRVKKGNRFGYIDGNGKKILGCRFGLAYDFYHGESGELNATAFDRKGCERITISAAGEVSMVHAICDF